MVPPNRTRDTRIFSPLLYQLSYGTILERGTKVILIFAGKIFVLLNHLIKPHQMSKFVEFSPTQTFEQYERKNIIILSSVAIIAIVLIIFFNRKDGYIPQVVKAQRGL